MPNDQAEVRIAVDQRAYGYATRWNSNTRERKELALELKAWRDESGVSLRNMAAQLSAAGAEQLSYSTIRRLVAAAGDPDRFEEAYTAANHPEDAVLDPRAIAAAQLEQQAEDLLMKAGVQWSQLAAKAADYTERALEELTYLEGVPIVGGGVVRLPFRREGDSDREFVQRFIQWLDTHQGEERRTT